MEFRYGRIQDLRLDLERLGNELARLPVDNPQDYLELRGLEERLRETVPLVADESVDCIVSNCVLNLVGHRERLQLFSEIFRVLRRGGRAAISDIVCDEDVPRLLQQNAELWSGCISGAFREDALLQAFEDAGFHGIQVVKRQRDPGKTVAGIEFRSVTVLAYKGKQGPCLERNQAVVYRGPFKKVEDDDGHVYLRGQRMAVCDKTFHLLQREPYQGMFETIEPRQPVPLEEAGSFDCRRATLRSTRETKGHRYSATTESIGPCCGSADPCC